jgi:hypothetical protein
MFLLQLAVIVGVSGLVAGAPIRPPLFGALDIQDSLADPGKIPGERAAAVPPGER